MADTWLTIEQAAVTLGLSVRTVNRHIVAGKLQSRLQDGRREVLVQTADKPSAASPTPSAMPSAPASAFASAAPSPADDSPFGAVLSPFASDAPSVTGPAIAGHATVNIPPPQPSSDRLSDRPADRASEAHHHPTIDTETVLALADNANEKAELAVSAYQALARHTDTQFQHVRRSARFAWAAVAVMAAGVSVAVGWTTHHLTKSQVQTQYLREQVENEMTAAEKLSAEREALRAELSAARELAARAEGKATALTDIQDKLEADIKETANKLTDAQSREARARAELDAALAASRAASPTPSSASVSEETKPTASPTALATPAADASVNPVRQAVEKNVMADSPRPATRPIVRPFNARAGNLQD